ncbi:tripartite tricarboxylate transporter substrate binding protein [Arthrobacter sp. NPDC089319]|uniref:Bug family tripartite tricarboxylate transporter substrate binding protein n=1 Tax=Arthrobacter sp. NPDC089319 TaxID=3155915 RepID=UPI0034369ACA
MNQRIINRRTLLGSAGVAVLLATTACGGVQGTNASAEYPTKAIEFIVPLAPGGSTDTLSRALAKSLSEEMGQPVAVINKPGAGATVGLKELKNANPDGYTVGLIPTSTLAVRPLSIKDSDPIAVGDFSVIKGLTTEDVVLYTYAGSEYKTGEDVAGLKGKNVKYASSGPGTVTGTAQALFFQAVGAEATGVPFDGGAPAKTAVLGKQVPFGAGHPGEIAEEVKAGTLVPLVVFSNEKSQYLPEVTTSAELGVDIAMDQRRLFGAPKDMPADILEKLVAATDKAIESDEYKKVLEQGYFTPLVQDGDTAAGEVETQLANYRTQVDALGVQLGG